MRNIVFFTEAKWAFGTIHNSLCKELYKYGINAELLDWEKQYSTDEIHRIADNTDYFVTTPVGIAYLINYNFPLEKIISVAHGQWDILLAKNHLGLDIYHKTAKFGAVSRILKDKAKEFGVPVECHEVPFGIHFDRFYSKPCDTLESVAMAGAYESFNFYGQEIKRGRLTESAMYGTGLNYVKHKFQHYLTMPSFYRSIGCVVMSSSEEGAGLPMMEAAAAGRLTLGTPVGYFEHNAPAGGGILLPIEENDFVKSLNQNLIHYKNNPQEYKQKCLDIQEFARENYDWSKHIEPWVNFLS